MSSTFAEARQRQEGEVEALTSIYGEDKVTLTEPGAVFALPVLGPLTPPPSAPTSSLSSSSSSSSSSSLSSSPVAAPTASAPSKLRTVRIAVTPDLALDQGADSELIRAALARETYFPPVFAVVTLPRKYPGDPNAVPSVAFEYALVPDRGRPHAFARGWLADEEVEEAQEQMRALHAAAHGDECIFEWMEWLRGWIRFPPPPRSLLATLPGPTSPTTRPEPSASTASAGTGAAPAAAVPAQVRDATLFGGVTATPFVVRMSEFQAHLFPIVSADEAMDRYKALVALPRYACATHNMWALSVETANGTRFDFDDDGEDGAGTRLRFLLQATKVKNVLVVVSRWFGGVLLGPSRFHYISEAALHILQDQGYVSKKDSS